MKKLIMLVCLLACALMLTAAAETYMYTDLDGDGEQELLSFYADEKDEDDIIPIVMQVCDKFYYTLDETPVFMYCQPEEIDTEMYMRVSTYPNGLGGRDIYVEAYQTSWENPVAYWMMYRFDGENIITRVMLYDVGATSAVEIDGGGTWLDNYSEVVYQVSFDEYTDSAYLNVINNKFKNYWMNFEFKSLPITGAPRMAGAAGEPALEFGNAELYLPVPQGASGLKQLIITGNVYMRTGAGKNYPALDVIKKDTVLECLSTAKDADGKEWYAVCYNGTEGYVSSEYAKFEDEWNAPAVGGTLVATGDVYIRATPEIGGKILSTLKKGKAIEWNGATSIDDRGVTWYRVDYKGKEGWVSSTYTKPQ